MITDKHKQFCREVVALARKHGMDHLDLTFVLNSAIRKELGTSCWEQVNMKWSEGRHGVEREIKLTTEAREEISERNES